MNHRRALDHVLALVAGASCGESLVLRGSMAMLAWFGARARPPADLDWVVRPLAGVPIDDLDPYPYVDRLDVARLWPEVTHGAGNYRIWEFEDLDTGGLAPRVPDEGLSWVHVEELRAAEPPHRQVLDLVRDRPRTSDGLVFDADAAVQDHTWGYEYGSSEEGGARILLPWRAGDERGSVQLDFAYDEALPDPPGFAAVPRADGRPAAVVWSASRELSLVWKIHWLAADWARDASVAGKDLYDAVLLAEWEGLSLSHRLRRRMVRAVPDPDAVREWAVDWSGLGGEPRQWAERLSTALRRHLVH